MTRKLKQTYPLTVDPSFPPLTVEGVYFEAYPALAVHKFENYYVIDHVPSGLFIWGFTRQREAFFALREISSLVDWNQSADDLVAIMKDNPLVFKYICNVLFHGEKCPVEKPQSLIPPAATRLSLF